METVQAGILAILISLSSWLHDGLKSFEAKKYDDAITKLTQVIDKDIPQNRYRDVALYYRAKSYHAKNEKKKALSDLLVLIQKYNTSYLSKKSTALYKELGGDMKKILPGDSPTKVWEKFVAAAKAGDLKGALKISVGKWRELVLEESDNDPEELKREFAREEIGVGEEKIGKGDDKGTATLELTADGNELIILEFMIDEKTKSWVISGFQEMGRQGGRRGGSNSNLLKLKQLGVGLITYSYDFNNKLPDKLETIVSDGYLADKDILLWTDTKTKKKIPFIYCPGLSTTDGAGKMLAAAPKTVNEKRLVVWLDGHVKAIPEKEFVKNARKQKWIIPGLVKKEEVPEKTKKKVLELIAKLADNDFDVRQNAKAELIKMMDSAYPILEENQNHKDPEIKMTIKEILHGK